MSIPAAIDRISAEDYLSLDRQAELRHEFVDGQLIAMTGGSFAHGLVTANVSRALGNALEHAPCVVVSSDVRVRVDDGLYAYPDVTVVCGEPELDAEHRDTLRNPTALFEVLSPSTEAFDRGEKFRRYQRIASLRHYALVSQEPSRIELFTRQGDFWVYRSVTAPDGWVELEALGCRIALDAVYRKMSQADDEVDA